MVTLQKSNRNLNISAMPVTKDFEIYKLIT
ncbi:hypothetical protein SAMN06264346_105177 [Chryseobacterium profundimaris]|uniref:Uncharacterized protein n=1 Tax=Chryseobacterium profundimaris TaxID=1387275 RepID=A0ABY1NW49_9FLAO|nr:hypothetical protein SAMN06264346_105177 [Chryseobacterium profundimaris]